MTNILERRFTFILWGLSLVNTVKLVKTIPSNFNNVTYFSLTVLLLFTFFYVLKKNRYNIRLTKPDIISLLIFLAYSYIFVTEILHMNSEVNLLLEIYSIIIIFLLDLSLFIKVVD